MTALYDLSNRPASFDFVTFLATAKAYGETHVRFVLGAWKRKNYTMAQAEERFASIVRPAVALFGMTFSVGPREGIEYSHMFPAALKTYRNTGRIGMITYPIVAKDYITVTLRKSRTPARDSKEDEWQKFAKRHKAVVIRDYEETLISLEDRMQLYASARMNLMIINGPLTLCIHSAAPYLSMRTIGCENSGSTSPWFMKAIGITPGFQFPWAGANQRLSYLDDTCENIEREYEAIMEQRAAA